LHPPTCETHFLVPLLPLFNEKKGKFELHEDINHLIGEMNAIRGVISGAKPFSGDSYMNQIHSGMDIVRFYQNVIIPVFLKEFPDKLERVIDSRGDAQFYNPSDDFSMFVKHMLANNEEFAVFKLDGSKHIVRIWKIFNFAFSSAR
jgi:hypothetical protein